MQQINHRLSLVKYLSFSHLNMFLSWILGLTAMILFYSCNSSTATAGPQAAPAPAMPVITLHAQPATTFQEFSASLEGSNDIEVRPQVIGTLDKIYVDEGAFVKKGQLLFAINSRPYQEQLNNARANLAAAEANLLNAQINADKLAPLVESNVVSGIQLKTAKANQTSAAASVAQAKAVVQNALIDLGYTQIKSPVDGYVGRIPFRAGSLVSTSTAEPLTIVSEIKEIHAYFSLSEKDFLQFSTQIEGTTIEDKIKHLPAVELLLADNTVYPEKGKVELAAGQFNDQMGAISFRATFKNHNGLIRSGSTGKVRVPRLIHTTLVLPQEASYEMQDKTYVFVVNDSNQVRSTPISLLGHTGNYHLVAKGLQEGDRVVYAGFERLQDGNQIEPQSISLDSMIKKNPL